MVGLLRRLRRNAIAGLVVAACLSWTTGTASAYSGGTYRYTSKQGSVTFTFTGTAFDWIASRGGVFGIGSVSIDGGPPVDVDLYAPSVVHRQTVFSAAGLAEGMHTVTIEYTGRKNPAASAAYVNVDAIDVDGTLP